MVVTDGVPMITVYTVVQVSRRVLNKTLEYLRTGESE